jgi:predicted RNA binding protein YcfA (HicA-like mRNA interferase family)
MKAYSSREIVKKLLDDGWFLYQVRGDHYQYKHTIKKGKVTLTHPKKDIPVGTLKNIEKQSGIIFE